MADAEAVRKQRQKQLEDKRKRLEELRQRKKVNYCTTAAVCISRDVGCRRQCLKSSLNDGAQHDHHHQAIVRVLLSTR